jgi:electron transport complex protein RnfD
VLAVFYMATDSVTSPLTGAGMILYGAGAGVLTFVLRTYGQFPESVALAIILMNVFVPLINRATGPRRFGLTPHRSSPRRPADSPRRSAGSSRPQTRSVAEEGGRA